MPHLGSQAVGHTGPLSGCVTDCAIAYSVMAGPDRRMSNTWAQPRVEIVGYNNTEALRGKRLGVYRPFFEHCDDQIAKSCNETVQKLVQNYGCEVVEIRIPRLDELKTAHFITICTESLLGTHQMKPEDQGNLQPSVRSVFGLAKNFTADDVARAMRLRTYFMKYMNEHVFTECDVVVTPTTGEVAGPVLGYPHGEDILDGELTGRIMRFAQIGNFTGIPAITVPASYTDEGLPIGIQFMSKWWDELTLFQMASAVEIECEKRKPELYMPVLKQ
ncbi:hypothetical protein SARC_07708 [Sphaeroforma arctica JP610]|uniref:Amidase domain-containing protein n=1 Tax=Sphaeroforma arctica JP610 TaxID=667725 RepID=A0A0L0FSX6_9EUKA|nr:hypothetical protein SARC_07708 [Sphaeroforma arctica JP610]KNC79917.1 hypothetical protein SARC_07708 [Sphaeroforma arctica JP610]|eukprot:XP_014153819.1 hypothetical protein SARC_07708 [Sphaeroforma arctica JP610]